MAEAGKVAVVTGGVRGLGAAITERFLAGGWTVVVTHLRASEQADQRVAAWVEQYGSAVESHLADCADPARMKQVFAQVVADHGPIDTLVNNAGIGHDGLAGTLSDQAWQSVLQTNLTGVFVASRGALPYLRRRAGASIINIASVSGLRGPVGQANYSAAKAGVIAFTGVLAKELARMGIRVNAVAPGLIESDMATALSPQAYRAYLEAIPMRRLGLPGEVANVVFFLAGQEASYVTGACVRVDGGLLS
jgi:3-oxoacyl-[acyl-carrier protein] reductase